MKTKLMRGVFSTLVIVWMGLIGFGIVQGFDKLPKSTAAPTSTPKPTPTSTTSLAVVKGVFSITSGGGNQPIENTTLSNASVDGVSIGEHWYVLEPSEGTYNTSYIDTELPRITAAGKKALFRVGTGGPRPSLGGNKPDFVVDAAGSAIFSYIDPNPYHKETYGKALTIPLFWDQTSLDKKKAMIVALGAKYSQNLTIKIFATNFANAFREDWSVPSDETVDGLPPTGSTQVSRLIAAGYTHAKMVNAGAQIIDTAMAAFPSQFIYVAMGPVKSSTLEPNGPFALAREVITNARNKWGNRLLIGHNGFSAKSGATSLQTSNPPWGGQALWFVFGDTTYRMNGKSNPDNLTADQILRNFFDKAVGATPLEVYERDVTNLPSAITYGHKLLNP